MMIEIALDLSVTLKLDCDHYFEVRNTVRVSLFVIACQNLTFITNRVIFRLKKSGFFIIFQKISSETI